MTATWPSCGLSRACGGNLAPMTGNRSQSPAGRASTATMSESRATDCPFCRMPAERILDSNAHALAVADAFPVSPGHSLVIPRRHADSFFELTAAEVVAVHELLHRLKDRLESTLEPD